jgi:hypothetical protein
MSCNSVAWFGVTLLAVVPAKAGTHNHRLWNMGPRLRGDDAIWIEPDSV